MNLEIKTFVIVIYNHMGMLVWVYKGAVTCVFVCLCFTSLQQRGHLETATPFSVPCEGREGR